MKHNEIPEKPILMSAPMVKATLADLKTQTRRIVKGRALDQLNILELTPSCPYGQPGHRLWVRESFSIYSHLENPICFYRADHHDDKYTKWKPSIHMFRKDSRILLEITGIRIERLQDISEDDARAEGCDLEWYRDNAGTENLWPCPKCQGFQVHGCLGANMGMSECDCVECDTAKKMFRHLWESINGVGSWDLNPYLWCIEFKRLTP